MPLGKADLLIIETLEPELKESLTLHSTIFWVPFDLCGDNQIKVRQPQFHSSDIQQGISIIVKSYFVMTIT